MAVKIVCLYEVSKTLASPGDADLRRLRRLGRYLLGTQKLGIMYERAMILRILMHTQMQTGVEIQPTEKVLRVEYSR